MWRVLGMSWDFILYFIGLLGFLSCDPASRRALRNGNPRPDSTVGSRE
jgi:hypothetical protein